MSFIKNILLLSAAAFTFIACGELPLEGSVSLNKSDNTVEIEAKESVPMQHNCNCAHKPMTLEEPPVLDGSNK